jgi:hypothetical protein
MKPHEGAESNLPKHDDSAPRFHNEILAEAARFVEEKYQEGWTQKDFARELRKFFDEMDQGKNQESP